MTKPDRVIKCTACGEENVVPEALISLDLWQCYSCGEMLDLEPQRATWLLAPLSLIALAVVLVL